MDGLVNDRREALAGMERFVEPWRSAVPRGSNSGKLGWIEEDVPHGEILFLTDIQLSAP